MRYESELSRILDQSNTGKKRHKTAGNGAGLNWIKTHVSHSGDECLIAPIRRLPQGSSMVGVNGKLLWSHRIMCQLAHGDQPSPKHQAAFLCDGRKLGCLNPRHLAWQTRPEIVSRAMKKHPITRKCGSRTPLEPETIQAIQHLRTTHTQVAVAQMLGLHVETVQYWANPNKRAGHKSFFWTNQKEREVVARAAAGATMAELIAAVGAKPTQTQAIKRFVDRAGLQIKPRPRIIVAKVVTMRDYEQPARLLAYPYMRCADAGDGLVFEVNKLVPVGMPGREDVCQDILLALLEGSVTLEEIKRPGGVRSFVSKFKRDSYESGGYAISLDQPRYDGRSWYDTLVDERTL